MRTTTMALRLALALSLAACGGSTTGDGGTDAGTRTDGPRTDSPGPTDSGTPPTDMPGIDLGPHDAGMAPTSVADRARAVATDLRGAPAHFLVGLGNSHDDTWTLGAALDLHYEYLVGYSDSGGWPTWNPGGMYVDNLANDAHSHGTTPMFTYYQFALELETGGDAALADPDRLGVYLSDVKLMFTRLGALGYPAVVTYEPDFFGYVEQRAMSGTAPDAFRVAVHATGFHDCDAYPENVPGLIACVLHLRDVNAPMVKFGCHASAWGDWYDVTDPGAPIETSAMSNAAFLRSVGCDQGDMIVVETLDRDAGFWETSGGGATCSITGGSRGVVYWDEANTALPNFRQHLRWVGALTTALGLPALWWQTPLGVPSTTCGGSDEHWRDNRVHYFFGHVDELVAAGGVGMTFGTGAGGQTFITTDGNQFHDAVTAYDAAPFALP